MFTLGKTLILFGIVLIVIGIIFMLGGKLSWFGRLPGDIFIQKKTLIFYFPITTSIIISIILSIIIFLFRRR
ncbi:MAG: hypothetical protein A2987_06365 [Omnitrophica bacterium RIFCSPLOWO2_01_FULL_45_10]|nr:MAG: hypothetical protein A2987_06365 [Omnitrophica bacterium RIFCSPLOWO2_01_FULL_45_10]